MKNVLNKSGLDDIFGALDKETGVIVRDEYVPTTNSSIEEDKLVSEKEQFVENELKVLLKNASSMLSVAKDIIETTPDAETVTSASAMINAVTNLITELNRNVILDRRFYNQAKLERVKIEAKKDLVQFKTELERSKIPHLGSGNTINVQNNNYVPFNQEDVVRSIIDAQRSKVIEGTAD